MKRWSEEAWEAAEGIYDSITRHPFVTQLADGTLSREKFLQYQRQDSLYIAEYSRVLAHIASRLPGMDRTADFIKFAGDGVYVERALHEVFLDGDRPDPSEMSPACLLYTSLLKACSYSSVEVEAAAVLPCFWVYLRVGLSIAEKQAGVAGNPYKAWIDTYSDPAFVESTRRAIEICDELAEAATPEVRKQMTEIFVRCTRMEWLFWDSAWNLEQWKI
ncbi:MAG: TenA family protein [Muribaculaceae bacterium]|nr:TenA family protein [Muribaculaceae bacterium]